MKFTIKNIGAIDTADIEINNLTIVCGENNTGKTYATYAIYGFLKKIKPYIKEYLSNYLKGLECKEHIIDIKELYAVINNDYKKDAELRYASELGSIFGTNKNRFSSSSLEFFMSINSDCVEKEYTSTFSGFSDKPLYTINKPENSSKINLIISDDKDDFFFDEAFEYIAADIVDMLLSSEIPDVYISSVERTGVAIFREELDFARSKALEDISSMKLISSMRKRAKMSASYALPIRDNVNFVRRIEAMNRRTLSSNLEKEGYKELFNELSEIISGRYGVDDENTLFYSPKSDSSKKYQMSESSSSIRALLDINHYLSYFLEKGALLIIDEPELNLHPKNQRLIARFIASLVNFGIKVMITTHSDYIVKEINSLIMINRLDKDDKQKISKEYGYKPSHMLDSDNVSIYVARKDVVDGKKIQSLVKADVHPFYGVEVESFDNSIEEINKIQSCVLSKAPIDFL